jgi:hypothetical protein
MLGIYRVTARLVKFILKINIIFEVIVEASKKNAVLWYVTPYDSCKNRRFGRTFRLHQQGETNHRARNTVMSV